MFAFVSNEYRAVVKTQTQLNFLLSIYSYPTFKKVNTYDEAHQFFKEHERKWIDNSIKIFGKKQSKIGYISIEYFIDNENIYYNIYTNRFGNIRFNLPESIKYTIDGSLLKIKVENHNLSNAYIAHHCTAISYILKVVGKFINVDLILPNISVYMALTKYTGKNFSIKNAQRDINNHLGNVYYTIKQN